MTILTRLVTFCTHHRPQSRHISGKCRSVPILTLSGSYGVARGLMLPIESERVQRAIFGACQTNAATLPATCLWLAGRPGLTPPDPGWAGIWRAAQNRRPACGFLALDEAVSDRLAGGQRPAAARVFADLVHLAAGDVGQPEVQRVEHARHLLLAGGERGH